MIHILAIALLVWHFARGMVLCCSYFISVCKGNRVGVMLTSNLKFMLGNSLAVQWLRLRASTAGGMGSIPGRGIKILHVVRPKKEKVYARGKQV